MRLSLRSTGISPCGELVWRGAVEQPVDAHGAHLTPAVGAGGCLVLEAPRELRLAQHDDARPTKVAARTTDGDLRDEPGGIVGRGRIDELAAGRPARPR